MRSARRWGGVIAALAATVGFTACDKVNNPAPVPSFTARPESPTVGENVSLDAIETQFRTPGTRWEWDTNGDGEADQVIDGSGGVEIQTTFDSPGPHVVNLVALNVTSTETGFMHVYGNGSRTIVVRPAPTAPPPPANAPPSAAFETDADPGYTGEVVTFDATRAADPGGRIVKYEWDFDGDGEFDLGTEDAKADFKYARDGVYKARLRVTDNEGATAEKVGAVPIENGPPPSGVRAAAAGGTSLSLLMAGDMLDEGTGFMTANSMAQVGIRVRGEMVLKHLPRPLPSKDKVDWRARYSVQQRGQGSATRVAAEGYLVVAFDRRDRLCMSGQVSGSPGRRTTGRLAIVGGTGGLRRASGAFDLTVPPTAIGKKGMGVGGKLRLRLRAPARTLPAPCRTLVRSLH